MMISFFIYSSISFSAEDLYDYQQKAKNRNYIGGSEESNLSVLPENYFEKNKKNKTEEVNEGF